MPQPGGEGGGIEADRAADPETGNAIFGGEFVDLALGDIQQFGNVGDGESVSSPVERVGEIHELCYPTITAPEQARSCAKSYAPHSGHVYLTEVTAPVAAVTLC